jgi:TfoX/Sxy family transcriptional regulator of competence genes
MATSTKFAEYVVDQLSSLEKISCRKMFGEYAVYHDGKVVILICDNQVFVKVTEVGKAYVGEISLAPPYPGAKDCFLIDDKVDDSEWLCELVRITSKALPAPKPKKTRTKKGEG